MRKRLVLIAAPLCVVAVAASVAVAAPSDPNHSRGPKLDKLHAGRPIAASQGEGDVPLSVAVGQFEQDAKKVQEYLRSLQATDSITAKMVGDYLASLEARGAPRQVSSFLSYNSRASDVLACIRQRESGGNYSIYNSGGSGAAGAYQFLPSTWNSIASSSGRADLVGVDPAQAAPADQDAMALALYEQQGTAPWGGGC